MLAPVSWLKDYVEINVSPEKLASKLVSIGFEVEEIIYQNKVVGGVVVGRIESFEKHPNADKLTVCQIDVGSKVIQVVTNVKIFGGETVAVALDGARLSGGFEIKRGELRGVLSEGMLCGLEELNITADDVEGQKSGDIIRFNESAELGANALDALGYNDVILDVGVTANRPDCNSIFKLAREVAVALKEECKEPEIDFYATADCKTSDIVGVTVENKTLCPRYMAAGVKNIKIAPSPQIIKSRLRAVGIRPINNIVDITNYVLTEIGQPMHAFDRRDLKGGEIIVRNAGDGEHIVTLDGKNNALTSEMLVIADGERAVALAGIMGGENSGIKDDTTEIVFESAKFARENVRRTSRKLNLRSDSSARFEKGIDFASQEYGIKRALTLVNKLGAGDIAEGIIDVSDFVGEKRIDFTVKKIKEILGCNVPKNTLISILARLGVKVEDRGRGELTAIVKEDREDIVGVNDLAEEFIRVYGYSHVEPTLFADARLTRGGKTDKIAFVDSVKNALSEYGLSECVTYSFTTPKFADVLKLPNDSELRKFIVLQNPLGEAMSVMRTTLVYSMLETMAFNISRFNKEAALFEVAKVYKPESLPVEEELPYEEEKLVLGMYGSNADFYAIKGALDALADALNVSFDYIKTSEITYMHPGRCAEIATADGTVIGSVGEIHPDVTQAFSVDKRLYVAEISLDMLFERKGGRIRFAPFSKFPTVERDLAVVVDDKVEAGELLKAVKEGKIKYLANASVFDVYKGEQVGADKKSVAMSFEFSSLERTLKDEEVAEQMSAILRLLKRKFGAKIR